MVQWMTRGDGALVLERLTDPCLELGRVAELPYRATAIVRVPATGVSMHIYSVPPVLHHVQRQLCVTNKIG
jgi:hypothetical protein